MASSIEQVIQEKYGQVAKSGLSTEHTGVRSVAEAFGYSQEELSSIPADANMGLSCGNPTAFASLRPGEVVVDLGSGGGLDVFLAAKSVGPEGKAIGIDMTSEMIELARKNALKIGNGSSPRNIEFHLATIDQMPLADASVDCIISNCVINLVPDKAKAFAEMARILKPGGRLAICDLAENLMAYVGCIAGAIEIEEYRRGLLAAGFAGVEIQDSGSDLNAYAQVEGQGGCCSPAMTSDDGGLAVIDAGCCTPAASANTGIHADLDDLLSKYNVNDFAASVKVFAVKG
jgi:arsenite methyltransferase